MRATIACCLMHLALCAGMAAQSGSSDRDNTGRIMALESAWNQAEVAHDGKAMGMLLADNFQYTDFDGTFMNKSQWLEVVKKSVNEYEELGNIEVVVHVYGNVAIVTGGYRQRLKNKKNAAVRLGRFTDVWVLQYGRWLCVASQATLVSH
jgi:ketosteroid isomerase-like protein